MTAKPEPALTPSEWRLRLAGGSYELDGMLFAEDGRAAFPSRHGLAAAFLHGQPFGFTREDVQMLETEIRWWSGYTIETHLRSLADRIEALLPPERSE